MLIAIRSRNNGAYGWCPNTCKNPSVMMLGMSNFALQIKYGRPQIQQGQQDGGGRGGASARCPSTQTPTPFSVLSQSTIHPSQDPKMYSHAIYMYIYICIYIFRRYATLLSTQHDCTLCATVRSYSRGSPVEPIEGIVTSADHVCYPV